MLRRHFLADNGGEYTYVEYVRNVKKTNVIGGYLNWKTTDFFIDFKPNVVDYGDVFHAGYDMLRVRDEIGQYYFRAYWFNEKIGSAHNTTTRYQIEKRGMLILFNNVQNWDMTSYNFNFTTTEPMTLPDYDMNIYEIIIKENNIITVHLKPAIRNSDNANGLHDIINNKFYITV